MASTNREIDYENEGERMTATKKKRGWAWAYRKIRGLYCNPVSAAYRATLYSIRGDTGTFMSRVSQRKIRITR
jgi:hypothetical protein